MVKKLWVVVLPLMGVQVPATIGVIDQPRAVSPLLLQDPRYVLQGLPLPGRRVVPIELGLEEYGLIEPAIIRPIEDSDECWVVPQDPESGGRFRLPRAKARANRLI